VQSFAAPAVIFAARWPTGLAKPGSVGKLPRFYYGGVVATLLIGEM